MEKSEVLSVLGTLKSAVKKELAKNEWDNALVLTKVAARLLYSTNLYYQDADLESFLRDISLGMNLQTGLVNGTPDSELALFYDGFGFNQRGLVQQYLRALTKSHRVIYVTYNSAKQSIPDIISLLESSGSIICWIEPGTLVNQIHQLVKIVTTYSPKHFFFYGRPEDVAAISVLHALSGKVSRYLINLTDHTFWLGASAIDYCIEFRDYGASISVEYRGIPKEKIVMIPYYPLVDEKEFLGFPFEIKPNNKVVFSGGSLYKTLGSGNLYYKIVDFILEKYEDTVFWYAGKGDQTEIDKILKKYPTRAFLTSERTDLLEVLRHSYLYLSTYPVCGGLMFQYAALAKKVPLTLRQSEISDGFLLNQESLGIQFDELEALFNELDHLMRDEEYTRRKGEQMYSAVIRSEDFEKEVALLLMGEKGCFPVHYTHYDTSSFRDVYIHNASNRTINELLADRNAFVIFKYLPVRYLKGAMSKIRRKSRRLRNHDNAQ